MDKKRVLELININSSAYPQLHIALVETLVDAGGEVLTDITSDQNFDENRLKILQALNKALGWNSLFFGLRGDIMTVSPELLPKCIESVEILGEALDYMKANCEVDEEELFYTELIKKKVQEQRENLEQARIVCLINKASNPQSEIFQDDFIVNRRATLVVLRKIFGKEELTEKFSEEMNKVGTIVMNFQKSCEIKMQDKTGS